MTLIEGSATVSRELELNPEPGILVESLRDIGYSFQSALADIVDNSLAARATKIELFALPMQKSGFMVGIIDNGTGLRRNDLLRAMRLGSSNPRDTRVRGDLGRFGLGLKLHPFRSAADSLYFREKMVRRQLSAGTSMKSLKIISGILLNLLIFHPFSGWKSWGSQELWSCGRK